ncbi:MAG: division/cell wall cluster transcriptional repressor MraZ [bacterium]
MSYFHSKYDYTTDDKNRLSIPAKYRQVMSDLKEKKFVISALQDSRLTLYPESTFENKIAKRIADLPQLDEDADEIRRNIGENTIDIPLDNQGRIIIPANFRQHAGINKKVKIVGCMNKFEIWNPETYEKFSQQSDKKSIKAELKKFKI